jgi:hypothetical protein
VGYPDYSKIKIYMTILFVLMKTPTIDNWITRTHCHWSKNITGFVAKIYNDLVSLRENPTLPTALVFAASQSKGSRQRSPFDDCLNSQSAKESLSTARRLWAVGHSKQSAKDVFADWQSAKTNRRQR